MKPTALVVEDEETFGAMLTELLEAQGFEAELALNGADAVRRLEHRRFSLVLLDLVLPVLDGNGVLDWLASHPNGARVVVMSSALPDRVERRRYDDFLAKPFRFDDLLRVAEKARP